MDWPQINTSRFNWLTDPVQGCEKPLYDVVVDETAEFVALPSLGSLVTGWLLVVPRRRIPSMAFLSAAENEELELVCGAVIKASCSFRSVRVPI